MDLGAIKVRLPTFTSKLAEPPRSYLLVIEEAAKKLLHIDTVLATKQRKRELLFRHLEEGTCPNSLAVQHTLNISNTAKAHFPTTSADLRTGFLHNIKEYQKKQVDLFLKLANVEIDAMKKEFEEIIPAMFAQLFDYLTPIYDKLSPSCKGIPFSDFKSWILRSSDTISHENLNLSSSKESIDGEIAPSVTSDISEDNLALPSKRSRDTSPPRFTGDHLYVVTWLLAIPKIFKDLLESQHQKRFIFQADKETLRKQKAKDKQKASIMELELPKDEKVMNLVNVAISSHLKKLKQELKVGNSHAISKKSNKNKRIANTNPNPKQANSSKKKVKSANYSKNSKQAKNGKRGPLKPAKGSRNSTRSTLSSLKQQNKADAVPRRKSVAKRKPAKEKKKQEKRKDNVKRK